MPLVRCDYDETSFSDFSAFTQDLLDISIDVFDSDADHISIFCSAYGPHDRSTAAAEIEYRAAQKEFLDDTRSPQEMKEYFLSELSTKISELKKKHSIDKGMIVTVTPEDWKVEWLD